MVLLGWYDLRLQAGGEIETIANVDPNRYSYLELVDDVLNGFFKNNGAVGLTIEMEYEVWRDKSRRNITGDKDILEMFNMNGMTAEIDVYVNFLPCEPLTIEAPTSQVTQVMPTPKVMDVTNKGKHIVINDDKIARTAASDQTKRRGFEEDDGYNVDLGVGKHFGDDAQYGEDFHREEHSAGEDMVDSDEAGSTSSGSDKEGSLGSGSDEEWVGEDEVDSEDTIDLVSDEGNENIGEDSDGLSDFQEDCEEMGHYVGSDSDKEKTYIDRGIQGKLFMRQPYGKVQLEKGLLFIDMHDFRAALKDFVIQEGFEIKRIKNEKSRLTCICAAKNCSWRIHASPTPDGHTYKIKTYNPIHCCITNVKNRNATSTWITEKLKGKLLADPKLSYKSMSQELVEQWGIEAYPMQLYRARRNVNDDNKGSYVKSYNKLPSWCALLKQTNPGSVMNMEFDFPKMYATPQFKRVFLCIDAMRKGFVRGCRPWLGIDGCHLKGPFGGILLSAVALDGNKGMFPIAIAIVETESKETWSYFLYNLHEALSNLPKFFALPGLTIMSDQHKGLLHAVAATMPYARQRYCCNHLLNNFKLKYPELVLRPLFWTVAKAPTQCVFNKVLDKIRAFSPSAANWLLGRPMGMWARHTIDPTFKSNHVTNNVSESFNNWLGDDKSKMILSLLESFRTRMMAKLYKRYSNACRWDSYITPRIRRVLDLTLQDGRACHVTPAGDDEYQVLDGYTIFVVNLRTQSCGCNAWMLSGLPCKHACACVTHKRSDVQRFCSEWYSRQRFMKAYSEIIHPMPHLDDETVTLLAPEYGPIDPPSLHRARGRPKKSKRKATDERHSGVGDARRSSTVRCDICKQFGRNKRTCNEGPVNKKGKKRARDDDKGRMDAIGPANTKKQTKTESTSGKACDDITKMGTAPATTGMAEACTNATVQIKGNSIGTKAATLETSSNASASVGVTTNFHPLSANNGNPNDWAAF